MRIISTGIFAQQGAPESPADVAFWVVYWGQPGAVLVGPEEEAFNQNVHEIMFPWNDHDEPSNPSDLADNVQWLKIIQAIAFTSRVTHPPEVTWSTISWFHSGERIGSSKL
jgi:hypothetical protein